ncbi:ABC transporter family substrate-binding protein [Streptomyces sp. N2-109]|uniref:ABC transporter family substrate-binding protein n=1 Tax=Streptomyces gossypii TaxID=2883101 RepID=A0ABT2JVL2_9ACTN|nr:ABC transporter family substrate-binding protein [Streptomyces gossypii]
MPAKPVVPAVGGGTRGRRRAVVLATGLLLPLAGCTSDDGGGARGASGAALDVPAAARARVADGGTLRWAVDKMPSTLNAFQPDATEATARIAAATLPALFTLDGSGRPQRNPAYLEAADLTEREPQQTIVYTLNPKARWSDGRAVGAADFAAQWKALSGEDSAYWSARNSGYERIGKVTKGPEPHQVTVTFEQPYADWKSLFTPLYPKSVMGRAKTFNEGVRAELPVSGGPFRIKRIGTGAETATLVRNPRWWGSRAKLERIRLVAVAPQRREAALAAGDLDLAAIGTEVAGRIEAAGTAGRGAVQDGKRRKDSAQRRGDTAGAPVDTVALPRTGVVTRERATAAMRAWTKAHKPKKSLREAGEQRGTAADERRRLRGYSVRRALDPAYTQLALNGASGPLADQRVRRAVARALDREALARHALRPARLPEKPLGSHLRVRDQEGYRDRSDALGGHDVASAQSLLAEAGWKDAPVTEPEVEGSADAKTDNRAPRDNRDHGGDRGDGGDGVSVQGKAAASGSSGGDTLAAPVTAREAARIQGVPLSLAPHTADQRAGLLAQVARVVRADEETAEGDSGSPAGDADGDMDADGGDRGKRKARTATEAAEEARARADELRLLSSGRAAAVRTKEGTPLSLRFVIPSGHGSETIQRSGARIARTLNTIGIRTEMTKVKDESYFRDHIASGDFDLALYSWPASAYPATDAQPIFAKPVPAPDGTLLVEQNYTRVGTDRIDQLFEEATAELDDNARRELLSSADARIWAAAGSIPLYQRPQLVAADKKLVNAGAFGFQTPRYQDIGYRK